MPIYSQQTAQHNGTTGTVNIAVGDGDNGGGLPDHVNVQVSINNQSYTFQPQNSSSTPTYQHTMGPGNTVRWMEIVTATGNPSFVTIVYGFAVPTGAQSTHATVQVFHSRSGLPLTMPQSVPILVSGTLSLAQHYYEPLWTRSLSNIEDRLQKILERLQGGC